MIFISCPQWTCAQKINRKNISTALVLCVCMCMSLCVCMWVCVINLYVCINAVEVMVLLMHILRTEVEEVPMLLGLFLETGSFTEPEAHWLARLTGQQVLGSACFCLLQVGKFSTYIIGLGSVLRSSCLHIKHFTHKAIPPIHSYF